MIEPYKYTEESSDDREFITDETVENGSEPWSGDEGVVGEDLSDEEPQKVRDDWRELYKEFRTQQKDLEKLIGAHYEEGESSSMRNPPQLLQCLGCGQFEASQCGCFQ